MDPELAMALRVSMEEERARQEAASKATADQDAADTMAAGGDAGGKGDASAASAEESKSGGVKDVGDSADADAMQVSSWRFWRREFRGWREERKIEPAVGVPCVVQQMWYGDHM